MSNEIEEHEETLSQVLDKTLHRFKNNLQTQLSLMNIQTSTSRSYFDDKKIIVDRIFALTQVYDLFYSTRKGESLSEDSSVSLQSFMLQFFQYLKSSSPKIDFELTEISDVKVDVDDLLLLSYILIEINDFRKTLDDILTVEVYRKNKNVLFKLSFSSLERHQKFQDLFQDQFKILDLMVLQLKGKFDYKNKFVRLSFPIL